MEALGAGVSLALTLWLSLRYPLSLRYLLSLRYHLSLRYLGSQLLLLAAVSPLTANPSRYATAISALNVVPPVCLAISLRYPSLPLTGTVAAGGDCTVY